MPKHPNILLFLTDDHAQWANGAYGDREIMTPNLDSLAEEGVLMENAYTPTPVCSPGRACLLTGRFASQHGLHDYLGGVPDIDVDGYPWMADETLLPEILHDAGYATYLSGKWHLGGENHPRGGFDHTFTHGNDYPFTHGGRRTFYEDGEPIEMTGYKTRIFTEKAIQYLRERAPDQPFYLQVGYITTHNPWEGHPERLAAHYRHCSFDELPGGETYPFGIQNLESAFDYRDDPHESRAQYYAAVTQIDEGVGQILDELEALGLREDTLIVYTADHGLNCGQHGIWGKGNGTLPLNMVEESVRVPLILNRTEQFPPGQRRTAFVDHTDLFQTLLDLAGVTLDPVFRAERNYPGRTYAGPLIHAAPLKNWKDVQIGEYGDVRMIRDERYKLVRRYPDGPNEFFDLEADPREMTNLYDRPEHQARIAELTAKLDAFFDQYADRVKNGLNVKQLPMHNSGESWRDPRNPQY
jgi:arylsulfatase A-like enzyme